MSGAWEIDFVLAAEMDLTLSFDYELILAAGYESNESSQLLVSLDGGTPILIDELIGNGNGGSDDTTGLQSLELDLGSLTAGSHSLAIGAFNNQKTIADESTSLTIDDVLLTGTAASVSAVGAAAAVMRPASGRGDDLPDPGLAEQELLSLTGT